MITKRQTVFETISHEATRVVESEAKCPTPSFQSFPTLNFPKFPTA